MKWIDAEYGEQWPEHEEAIRAHIKKHFSELKEAKIKELLKAETWQAQKQILLKAEQLQKHIGAEQCDDMNGYEAAIKQSEIKLEAKEKKQITSAVSWKNPDAEKVIKKIHKGKANPVYGLFEVDGQVVEYKPDGDLRDNENVALRENIEDYFAKEVLPHVSDAWIDASKKDDKDQEIGIVGYEIPFNRHFYVYQAPRELGEIDAELDKVSGEIMELLREVHS